MIPPSFPNYPHNAKVNASELYEIFDISTTYSPLYSITAYSMALKWLLRNVVSLMFVNDFVIAGILLMLINYCAQMVKRGILMSIHYMYSKFVFTLCIQSDDEAFTWLMEWLSTQNYTEKANNLSVYSTWSTSQASGVHGSRHHQYNQVQDEETAKRPKVYYVPAVGSHILFFQRQLIWFVRRKKENNSSNSMLYGRFDGGQNKFSGEEIQLVTIGYNKSLLKELVRVACDASYKASESKTFIYTPVSYQQSWAKVTSRHIRPLDSVILPGNIKDKVVQDVKTFTESREWYSSCGVPYRRGILLYGPPGTGKSSTVIAIAGELRMNVCMLSLASSTISDDSLQGYLNCAPLNSIILLEDVDCALSSEEKETPDAQANQMMLMMGRRGTKSLTFAGILNALDGVASQEGRILFMTTNHIEKLDPALIRPGRIDLRVKFELASSDQIRLMFLRFFPGEEKKADKVATAIPDHRISTAQLQGFFLLHRKDAAAVLPDTPRFLKECEEYEQISMQKQAEKEAKKETTAQVSQELPVQNDSSTSVKTEKRKRQ